MPSRFVSVKKSDPIFLKYLWGRAEEGVKVVPIQSLNSGSAEESVTFEFKPLAEISKPSYFQLISAIIKLKSFILILFPLFFVLTRSLVMNQMQDPFSLAFAAAALIFIFAGLNIRNDISDHLSGFDLINIPFSPKPLIKGWITAHQLSRLSWVLMITGIVLSLPVLILQQEEIKVVAVVATLLVVGQFFEKNSYKEKELGELILFILMGIGVVAGFQIAMGSKINTEISLFGVFWGAVILFLVHINNFSHLLTSTQAGIKNSVTALGFDKAKKFLMAWWILCLLTWFFLHLYFTSLLIVWIQSVALIVASLPLLIKLHRIRSPLGSDLVDVRKLAYKTFLTMVFLFFIECVWYLVSYAHGKI